MIYFELFLTTMVLLCAFLAAIGVFYKPLQNNRIIKFGRSYFPVFLLVLLVRSFVFQPFKVVSGSLEPTVLIGDYLAVNQAAYGLRLPVVHSKIFDTNKPHVGDIALFYFPENPKLVFVKRVIGIPGDHIVYKNKILTINGKEMPQSEDGIGFDIEPNLPPKLMLQKTESLNGHLHKIYVSDAPSFDDIEVIVPENSYFMMGDNRDDSDDSRRWGFVPEQNLIGRAYRILFSWDGDSHKPRFRRIAQKVG